jgi:hypothetical protein
MQDYLMELIGILKGMGSFWQPPEQWLSKIVVQVNLENESNKDSKNKGVQYDSVGCCILTWFDAADSDGECRKKILRNLSIVHKGIGNVWSVTVKRGDRGKGGN